jgi:hypothetical protein
MAELVRRITGRRGKAHAALSAAVQKYYMDRAEFLLGLCLATLVRDAIDVPAICRAVEKSIGGA